MSDDTPTAFIYEVTPPGDGDEWHTTVARDPPTETVAEMDNVEYRNVRELLPKDALRELIEAWRDGADEHTARGEQATTPEGMSYGEGLAHAFECAADELEAVLEDD